MAYHVLLPDCGNCQEAVTALSVFPRLGFCSFISGDLAFQETHSQSSMMLVAQCSAQTHCSVGEQLSENSWERKSHIDASPAPAMPTISGFKSTAIAVSCVQPIQCHLDHGCRSGFADSVHLWKSFLQHFAQNPTKAGSFHSISEKVKHMTSNFHQGFHAGLASTWCRQIQSREPAVLVSTVSHLQYWLWGNYKKKGRCLINLLFLPKSRFSPNTHVFHLDNNWEQ